MSSKYNVFINLTLKQNSVNYALLMWAASKIRKFNIINLTSLNRYLMQ